MRALFFALAALSLFAVLTARPISFYENGEEYHYGHIPEQYENNASPVKLSVATGLYLIDLDNVQERTDIDLL